MSLVEISRQFDDMTLALLRSCIGHEFKAYSGYCLFDEADHIGPAPRDQKSDALFHRRRPV